MTVGMTPDQQLVSARTIFSIYPIDPPLSPPPTSPLPALPIGARSVDQRTRSIASKRSSKCKPVRPPRPHSTLQNIKPRTITSPPPSNRKRISLLPSQLQTSPKRPTESVDVGNKHCSIRLLTPDTETAFSEDVLSALPRIFQSPPREVPDILVGSSTTNYAINHRLHEWQSDHSPQSRGKASKRTSSPNKAIARTALFIPQHIEKGKQTAHRFPPRQNSLSSRCGLVEPFGHGKDRDSSRDRSTGSAQIHRTQYGRIDNNSTFTFDFAGEADDQLTSLPQCTGSTNELSVSLPKALSAAKPAPAHLITRNRSSADIMTFFALPYGDTVKSADSNSNMLNFRRAVEFEIIHESAGDVQGRFDAQMSSALTQVHPSVPELEAETRQLTPEEQKKRKRKRLIWALITAAVVLLTTAGILGGILVRLVSIGIPGKPIPPSSHGVPEAVRSQSNN